jgi:low temperature requirement protein LtrA
MDATGQPVDGDDRQEQQATWTELFFDLVVVAGIGQLTHLLHDKPSLADVALYVLLYFAFWTAWTGFTVYGAVEGDRASTVTMLLGMLGMAVIATSVDGSRGARAPVFVIGYVVLRWFAGHLWRRATVVMDWPLAQLGIGTLPWVISLWTAAPARYWLWAAGIGLDFAVLFTVSGSRMLHEATTRLERVTRRHQYDQRHQDNRRGGAAHAPAPTIEAAYANAPHLAERLGLYVIIMLGEGFILAISAASKVHWQPSSIATGLGAFAFLVGVWITALLDGFAGVPLLRDGALPLRLVILAHSQTTATIAALAAGLGAAVTHATDTLPAGSRWLLCGATATYLLIAMVAALPNHSSPIRLLSWAVPGLVIPLLMGVLGGYIGIGWLTWILTATLYWQILCNHTIARATGAASQ